MTEYVIAPPAVSAVPVAGGGLFPVRRIFCVGRNYAEHAREMGSDPDREPPFFFAKPADALLTGGADMPYPPKSNSLHHEMELVVALGTGGADIAVADALRHVWGYAAGLDMTRRDLQNAAKKEGKPWRSRSELIFQVATRSVWRPEGGAFGDVPGLPAIRRSGFSPCRYRQPHLPAHRRAPLRRRRPGCR